MILMPKGVGMRFDQLREWISRGEEKSEQVTMALVERFKTTFNQVECVALGDITPLLFHFCIALPVVPTLGLGPDGHPIRGGFLPPVPLPRRMWAAGALELHGHIRVGETVIRRSRIQDVAQKDGRAGKLCFVTVNHEISSNGRRVLNERQDIVYLDVVSSDGPKKAAAPAAHGRFHERVELTPTLLFRYSALTFNSHRIHYDLPYARETEGYPGLVVHGPLQATLLAQFAERLHGQRPRRFTFRSLSPLFCTSDLNLNAEDDGTAMRLWTAAPQGPVAMEARAEW